MTIHTQLSVYNPSEILVNAVNYTWNKTPNDVLIASFRFPGMDFRLRQYTQELTKRALYAYIDTIEL